MSSALTIFLIDDDLDDQEFFELAIHETKPGVKCLFANDGLYALEKLTGMDSLPHLMFIDINMPRMNGIILLSEIKKSSRYKNIPIYMYSTFADARTIEQCKQLGALGFLKKHTSISDAKNEFEKLLQLLN